MNTDNIRNYYPDFVNKLRKSIKELLNLQELEKNNVNNKYDLGTYARFVNSCYYDDIEELEEIIFFTSSPFYEFSQVYKNIICPIYDNLRLSSESKNSFWEKYFWKEYKKLLESEFYKIKFKDSKFYFENVLVPINPYDKNQINIVVFDFVTEVDKFIRKNREEHPKGSDWQIFHRLINYDFVKNHNFNKQVYYYGQKIY